LTCVPWAIYVVTDLDEYIGQMQMYSDRFDLWHAAFYWTNITREIRRYAPFLGGFTRWHPGGWIAVVTFPLSVIVAVRTSVRDRSTPLFAVVVVLFVLVTLDALPLAVVIVASGWTWIWDRTRHAALRVVLVCALVAAMTDAGWRLVLRHRQALVTTPYEQIEQAIARQVPADARVLMALRFWLGLRNQPVRTWVLPLMLAECDACDRPRALAGALRQVAPEIVVIDDFEFGPYLDQIHDPADPGHWQDAVLRDYFLESGLQLIGEVRDPDYKTIRIYRVERP
jgi:hypothetical protein